MRKTLFATALLCAISLCPFPLHAQTSSLQAVAPPPPIAIDYYGTQDEIYTIIPAQDFRPWDSATGYSTNLGTGNISRTGGGASYFSHMIDIPTGAILLDITAYVFDNNATSNVDLYLGLSHRDAGAGTTPFIGFFAPVVSTDLTPGNTAIVKTWNNVLPKKTQYDGDPEIDETSYFVIIGLNAADNTTAFNSVRLRWKRQVSPAPATARFDDVPTSHPFFQYIEALAAAGITGGCVTSPPQYCPDAPITRGQMAVFMSRALGLHWTP